MAVKEPTCTFCPYCKEFFKIDEIHMHRFNVTPTNRNCLTIEQLKKAGWKKSKHIWSK